MPTTAQFRAARALLNWPRRKVAQVTGLSELTIIRLEDESVGASADTARRVQEALEEAGVRFTGTVGVKLRKRK